MWNIYSLKRLCSEYIHNTNVQIETHGLCRTWVTLHHWQPFLDLQFLEILSMGSRYRSSRSSVCDIEMYSFILKQSKVWNKNAFKNIEIFKNISAQTYRLVAICFIIQHGRPFSAIASGLHWPQSHLVLWKTLEEMKFIETIFIDNTEMQLTSDIKQMRVPTKWEF